MKKKLNDNKSPTKINNVLTMNNDSEILGEIITIIFISPSNLKTSLNIENNKKFKDAVINYCNKIKKDFSKADKELVFLFNSCRLKLDDERYLGQFLNSGSSITVFDLKEFVGA